MKLLNSRSNVDRLLLNSKIFQTINIPEKIKGLSQIQKYMSNLRYSLDLLDQSRFKKKNKFVSSFKISFNKKYKK